MHSHRRTAPWARENRDLKPLKFRLADTVSRPRELFLGHSPSAFFSTVAVHNERLDFFLLSEVGGGGGVECI